MKNNKRLTITLSIMTFLLLYASSAIAADQCGNLSTDQQRLVNELLASEHPYACCSDTMSIYLRQTPVCPLVRRLEQDICRMAHKGLSKV